MEGLLEGIESSYDSLGMGARRVSFATEPLVGQCFVTELEDGARLSTGRVESLRKDKHRISFRTKRTTYILWIDRSGPGDPLRSVEFTIS